MSPATTSSRRACIDVGTNSVKLLVADVSATAIAPVLETSTQTRLGSGFYETHQLQPGPIAKTAEAVATFAQRARALHASSIRVIGTSAMRDAKNAADLIQSIRQQAGLEIEIISGEQEAEWVFHGVTTDSALAQRSLLILDVGGGSSEFIVGEKNVLRFRASFALGSVRLYEQQTLDDPPGLAALAQCRKDLRHFLDQQVAPTLQPPLAACAHPIELIATGGTATILARMEAQMEDFDRDRIESLRLSLSDIAARLQVLWTMPLADRRKIVGLPPNRADVILTGMAIYEAILERFRLTELQVSTRGLRFAAVVQP